MRLKLIRHNTIWDAFAKSGRYGCSASHSNRFVALGKAIYRVLRFRITNKPYYQTVPVVNERRHTNNRLT